MSRGIGKSQREILEVMATAGLDRIWSRMELQQAVWGRQPGSRPDLLKRHIEGARPCKNVAWFATDHSERFESNFTRALSSLANRGLVHFAKRESGQMVKISITSAGFALIKGVPESCL